MVSTLIGLQCHVCHTPFPAEATYVCDQCFGPLEPVYDYDKARATFTREQIATRPRNLWRYRELLPITGEPRTGFGSGFTPLVPAPRLAERLGVRELYIKDDGVNHPTLSYKDRVVSVAATRAVELGFTTFGCASTGNLGNSVAAHAARLGLRCFVFIPDDLEPYKVLGSAVYQPTLLAVRGNYDDVNRLCTQVADKHGWGFANINLRSYYAEGAKTMGFEIVEQLGWRFPQHVVLPVAGGTLLPRVCRGFRELAQLGLADGPLPKIYGAQAAGSAPVMSPPPRPSVVISWSLVMPWKPATITTRPLSSSCTRRPVSTLAMRARLNEPSVRMPHCDAVSDTAGTPRSCRARLRSETAIVSPHASNWSISRPDGRPETWLAIAISWSVVLPIAETATTTCFASC